MTTDTYPVGWPSQKVLANLRAAKWGDKLPHDFTQEDWQDEYPEDPDARLGGHDNPYPDGDES